MPAIFENTANGQMRRKTLIKMRWLAICGQTAALAIAYLGFHIPVDILPAGCAILVSIIFNIVATHRLQGKPHLHNKGATFALAFDVLQLSALLYFTGGFTNPFAVLLFAPITIASTVLPGKSVSILIGISALSYGAMFFAKPLPWPEPQQFSPLFLGGCAAAIFISGAFVVIYVRRVAREARRLSEALNTSRLALEYEQKISAFGALAAAVAHELGSPLSTISIVAGELSRDLKNSEYAEDIELLQNQILRCSTILTDFSKHNVLSDRSFATVPLREFTLQIVEPYRRNNIEIVLVTNRPDGEPHWPLRPGLMHGIGNILHNACQFAATRVLISLHWNGDAVKIEVTDDGPGFSEELLPRLGSAYVSGRPPGSQGMGLGLFIAKMLLERSGANVAFSNTAPHGAFVSMEWQFYPT